MMSCLHWASAAAGFVPRHLEYDAADDKDMTITVDANLNSRSLLAHWLRQFWLLISPRSQPITRYKLSLATPNP